jgi:hypothetical protein
LSRDYLVKVHGNWCGPNWTGGRKLSAEEYKARGLSWDAPCTDALDCACRDHDRACSDPKGCSRKADTKLIQAAEKLQLSAFRSTSLEIALLNPTLSPGTRRRNKKLLELDRKADLIVDAITLARLTRRH